MALINCPECKTSMSDIAEKYSYCGNPMKQSISNKILISHATKRKVVRVLGIALNLIGLLTALVERGNKTGVDTGILLIILGVVAVRYGKFQYWWYMK